ncbi:hypothetical protein CCP3SC1AL1_2120003 [Gammaproteobacteria bacterium]
MYTLQDETNVWRSLFRSESDRAVEDLNGDVVEVTMTPALQRHYDVIARQLQVSEEDTQLSEGEQHGIDYNLGAGGPGLTVTGGQGGGGSETYTDNPGGQVLLLREGKRRPSGVQKLRTVSLTQETQEATLNAERVRQNQRLIREMGLKKTK